MTNLTPDELAEDMDEFCNRLDIHIATLDARITKADYITLSAREVLDLIKAAKFTVDLYDNMRLEQSALEKAAGVKPMEV